MVETLHDRESAQKRTPVPADVIEWHELSADEQAYVECLIERHADAWEAA
jgi:hypothetical protein